MAALTGNKIKDSYLGLLKTTNSGILTSSFVRITDGGGNNTQLYLSNAAIRFYDAYTFPSADGTVSGQVLTTDANGALSWADSSDNQTLDEVLTQGNTTDLAILSTADGNTFGSTIFDDAVTGTTANFTTSVTSPDFIGDLNGSVRFAAKMIGSSVLKGQVVYVSGLSGNTPEVQLAKANSTTTMTAVGIAADDANQNASFEVDTLGSARGIDLSDCIETGITLTEGDVLYVSATEAGHLTNVAPTGVANLIQNIGMAIRVDPTTNATIKVMGAGRANALPNLPTGILLGDTTNVSTAITDGSSGQILSTDGSGSYSFVDSTNDVTKTGTITANQIAVWNDSTDELRSDAAISIATDGTITLYQPNSDDPIVVTNSYNIGGGNIANVTGVNNVGFGKDNLSTITSGYENIAIGNEAGKGITTGNFNVSIGEYTAIRANSGQEHTTTVGWGANRWNTGNDNTAIGASALTGAYTGTNNGYSNTAIGASSLNNLTTGFENTSLGTDSLANLTTGQKNTALGYRSGNAITTGAKNVIIGSFDGSGTTINIAASNNNIVLSDGDGVVRQWINSNGKLQMPSYGSAAHTGTLAKTLGVDASGNVIEFDAAGGDVNISGTPVANQIAIWTDASTIKGDASFQFVTGIQNSIKLIRGTGAGNIKFLAADGTTLHGYIENQVSGNGLTIGQKDGVTSAAIDLDDSTITFKTNTTPQLTISSTGAATFSGSVTINGEGDTLTLTKSNNIPSLKLKGSGTDSATIEGGNNFNFYINGSSSVAITSGGVLQAKYGISFPNQSAGSGTPTSGGEVLDAYEEGTWTQTISAGYTSVTYIANETIGSYTRIGNIVTAFFYIRFSGLYVSGGSPVISGLPYAVNNNRKGGAITYTNLALNKNTPTAYPSVNSIYLYSNDIGSAGTLANPTADANAEYIIGSVTYGI
jgi:hypothetical protein